MNEADVLNIARQAIIVALKIGGPAMVLALVVGVAISIFQALTQIQEQTLTFMPKIVVILLSVLVLLPFMITTLKDFTHVLVARIVGIQ